MVTGGDGTDAAGSSSMGRHRDSPRRRHSSISSSSAHWVSERWKRSRGRISRCAHNFSDTSLVAPRGRNRYQVWNVACTYVRVSGFSCLVLAFLPAALIRSSPFTGNPRSFLPLQLTVIAARTLPAILSQNLADAPDDERIETHRCGALFCGPALPGDITPALANQ